LGFNTVVLARQATDDIQAAAERAGM